MLNSSLTNCVKMIKILQKNKNNWTSINELAKELNCSPAMVRKYKDTLIKSNYNIISVPGKNGGYKLEDVFLSEGELMILQDMLSNNKNLYKKIEYINSKI